MDFTTVRPMVASIADAALTDPQYVYEPKYDGIRVLVSVLARGGPLQIASQRGNDKTAQFLELVRAFKHVARKLKASVVLDGEIVALDEWANP